MQTKIFKPHQINQAVDLLKKGEIVALPTETVYGLAADAKNDIAIQKIFTAKNRPTNHPLIVHIDSVDKLSHWAENLSLEVRLLAERFWPGPLTILLKKREEVSNIITGGLNTVALRVPKHPIILEVINNLGSAIVAPSANAHKKTSPTQLEHVLKTLDGKIYGVVDGGKCAIGIESTIIDMTKEVPVILRPGSITAEMIEEVIKIKVKYLFNHNEKVSGNMKIHYQPEKPLFLMSLAQIQLLSKVETNIAVMHFSKISKYSSNITYYQMPKCKTKYAQILYTILHDIDATKVKKILVEITPSISEWSDVYDRLLKASTKI